ncbi:hypothetical protein FRB90_011279 [Tulasnella sp. 427]|nr:hypothetical protein FRB90_011279 [Tulasnella sp. 427]
MVRSGRLDNFQTTSVPDGPPHRPSWTFTIAIREQYFTATGSSKAQARENAAFNALYYLGFLDSYE